MQNAQQQASTAAAELGAAGASKYATFIGAGTDCCAGPPRCCRNITVVAQHRCFLSGWHARSVFAAKHQQAAHLQPKLSCRSQADSLPQHQDPQPSPMPADAEVSEALQVRSNGCLLCMPQEPKAHNENTSNTVPVC